MDKHICPDCKQLNGYPVQGLCMFCYARRQGYSNIEISQLRHGVKKAKKKTAPAATGTVN